MRPTFLVIILILRKGIEVGKEQRNFGKGITKEGLDTMFGQDSKRISKMAKDKE